LKLVHASIQALHDEYARTSGGDSAEKFQYLYPLGTLVPVTLEYGLAEAVYVAELRSSATVHPTLRPAAIKLGNFVQDNWGFPVHMDKTESSFCLKRGSQTIFENGVPIT